MWKGVVASIAAGVLGVADGVRQRKSGLRSCGVKGASTSNELNMSIVNGEDASPCEWKWQISFFYTPTRRSPFCGGTLIDPEWVLTAAHCMAVNNFVVRAGDHRTDAVSGKEQDRSPAEIYKSPYYSSFTKTHDYALVKLSSPFELNDCVGVACLPTSDTIAGSQCFITGWGTLSSGGSQPKTLQEAAVTIISNSDCVDEYGYSAGEIDNTMLCAQGRTSSGLITDACQGDSGGPLVCNSGGNWEVHGATSWGSGCAGANYPGVWARVHEVMPWIMDTMAGVPQPTTTPPPNFICNDGCDIRDTFLNDGYCDCTECEDEASFTCSTCSTRGCPTSCGEYTSCQR